MYYVDLNCRIPVFNWNVVENYRDEATWSTCSSDRLYFSLYPEIADWIRDNIKENHTYIGDSDDFSFGICFESKQEATLFKLFWC
jgi:hypothetical protein